MQQYEDMKTREEVERALSVAQSNGDHIAVGYLTEKLQRMANDPGMRGFDDLEKIFGGAFSKANGKMRSN